MSEINLSVVKRAVVTEEAKVYARQRTDLLQIEERSLEQRVDELFQELERLSIAPRRLATAVVDLVCLTLGTYILISEIYNRII